MVQRVEMGRLRLAHFLFMGTCSPEQQQNHGIIDRQTVFPLFVSGKKNGCHHFPSVSHLVILKKHYCSELPWRPGLTWSVMT